MNLAELTNQIHKKRSYLCIGLDTDVEKLPKHLQNRKNGVVTFNKAIIEATKEYCVSYKINTAFYESQGVQGWLAMEETLRQIPQTHFSIADAKRGDIGNTSAHYAKTFFETLPFDSVTVNPYMGEDSVRPFLEYKDKVTILLGLTSNKGASDFELRKITNYESNASHTDKYLYEVVLQQAASWGNADNMMFVAGATQAKQLAGIREIVPNHFLLVPGVGAQGGSLEEVSTAMNHLIGLLVNVSRGIIYAGNGEDFAEKAAEAAGDYQKQMNSLLKPSESNQQ